MMVISSGIVLFHLQLRSVNILSFMILWRWIRLLGLGAFFGMVGYTFFLVLMEVPLGLSPLLRELSIFLSVLLGGILPVSFLSGGCLLVFDVEGAARRVAEEPDVWTDGSLVDDKVSGVSFAGAGCFTDRVSRLWACWKWGHWDDDVGDGSVVSACRGFCSVLGPLQTVQRAELWGVILALQASDGVHLGVDNLGVVRHVGRILDGRVSSRPCELLLDGDFLFLIERMLHIRGLNTVRISKVKGHADEALVRAGAVRGLDKLGNDGADEAADFGRRRVPWWVIDARRNFSGVCSRWGESLKSCLFRGLMVLLASCLVLRILVFGLMGCLMLTLL